MKKYLVLAVAFLSISSLAFAAPKKAKASEGGLTPWVDKGDFIANVGIGWGGLSGGVELDLARIDIAKVLPVTFGAAARGLIDPGIFYDVFNFGVGGFGTAHLGFKEVKLPEGMGWVSNLDAYVGLGLGISGASGYDMGFGFSTFDGVSYYLNDNLALGFEYGYFGHTTWYYSSYYWSFCATLKL